MGLIVRDFQDELDRLFDAAEREAEDSKASPSCDWN
jgi:hypothetical protein